MREARACPPHGGACQNTRDAAVSGEHLPRHGRPPQSRALSPEHERCARIPPPSKGSERLLRPGAAASCFLPTPHTLPTGQRARDSASALTIGYALNPHPLTHTDCTSRSPPVVALLLVPEVRVVLPPQPVAVAEEVAGGAREHAVRRQLCGLQELRRQQGRSAATGARAFGLLGASDSAHSRAITIMS
eukprot:CAMPEP_0180253218 /NCGR_PEP_ID=MMETSP0987-20121128/39473_1 /TAXON_ID=697907 /ORGANISM="non described non described, Strain CCMP2293" /LENGTH=188 /DNA_ID=CAMNT_0022222051 /DNA_START=57 /DNA_END=621 /DNA_ORIENTATION=+